MLALFWFVLVGVCVVSVVMVGAWVWMWALVRVCGVGVIRFIVAVVCA